MWTFFTLRVANFLFRVMILFVGLGDESGESGHFTVAECTTILSLVLLDKVCDQASDAVPVACCEAKGAG